MLPALFQHWRPRVVGHWWTVTPELWDRVRPVRAPAGRPWQTNIDDPHMGSVRLYSVLREEPQASTLLVVVHGLGGDPESPYCRRAADLAARRGWSCLRFGMRGSAGNGEDLYHAGLGRDLGLALNDPAFDHYDRIVVFGYSLGGHVALTHGLDPHPKITAIAAVSSPLDLEHSCRLIDRRRAWVYRHHVLQGLKLAYRELAARREVPTPVSQVDRVGSIRQWDTLTVVPRFGFADVDDYYRRASVGPRLKGLKVPSLYMGMRHDPMIPPEAVEPSLSRANSSQLTIRWLDEGGHVAAPGRWEHEVLEWLDKPGG